ncbi:MAG: hypothetical protein BWX88_03369 [Planctomycetes bacterium ADurb.Bin126]|nr:MAG: hypothetical protein BWX88_03369 [Planctomycetes bacterium ADurb.Bin126]
MPDEPLERFQNIYTSYDSFCAVRGEVTESDTRANILDPLLHDVLLWPREAVFREVHGDNGYLDYRLTAGTPRLVWEAKRSGKTFVFPFSKRPQRRLKISTRLAGSPVLKAAVEQVQGYCVEHGIRYAVATNGYSFVILRAIVEGRSWRDGSAIIFYSPKDIIKNFNEFFNLLSYESVAEGHLEDAFRVGQVSSREYHRPLDKVLNSDATYGRNPINIALRPYVDQFFGDIASQDDITILEKCYVRSTPIQIIDKDLKLIVQDTVPSFAQQANQVRVTSASPGGNLGEDLRSVATSAPTQRGHVVVLMGGIGSGKSTFLKRFFKIVAPELVAPASQSFLLHLDFLGAPENLDQLDQYVWDEISRLLRARLPSLVTRSVLEAMFATELQILREVYGHDPARLARQVDDNLFQYAANSHVFSEHAIEYSKELGHFPIIVFDNVDQLSTASQISIFTIAQRCAQMYGTLSLLVLREESFCAAQMQRHLTAYTIRPYHLSSPDFLDLIRKRIDLAADAVAGSQRQNVLQEEGFQAQRVIDFFRLLKDSVFDRNRNIVRLVQAVSFGNARLALDLLNCFILSGATNTSKILEMFKAGGYTVPFHEFAKSVILGDYRYYKESRSFILNVFHVTGARNASHFTTLRILQYLSREHVADVRQQGFTDLHILVQSLSDMFDNEDDVIQVLMRLIALNRQLVELDTRRSDTLAGASTVRITSAGAYYLHYFVRSFAYLDLMWHDTAISSSSISDQLSRLIPNVYMTERFARTELFLEYLNGEEEEELASMQSVPHYLGPFMPTISKQYEREKKLIESKLRLTH